MNLTISKEQIINGLQAVQNVVSTRTTLPILSNVLLRAEGDRLEFTATDLDVTVACKVEAKVAKPGSTTLPILIYSSVKRGITPDINALSTLIILASVAGTVLVAVLQRLRAPDRN